MKLPKLFGKKRDDEDDFDDDIDEEDFDIEDLDDHVGDVETTVVEEDEDLTGNYGSGPVSGDNEDQDDDEVMIGSDDTIENPFDGVEDEYDDDFDDDEDYEEEDDESSRKKALIFAAIGGAVIISSVIGGVGWFMFSSPDEAIVAASNDPGRVELAMPAPPGSLNSSLSDSASDTGGQRIPNQASEADSAQSVAPEGDTQTAADVPSEAEPMVDPSEAGSAEPAGGLNSLNSLNTNQSAGGGVVVASISNAALARLPDHPSAADQSQALSPAPVAALVEDKKDIGQLPVIASNGGAQPWQVYARPVDPGITAPRIAIMIEGVGLSRQASLGVINKLPPEVSFVLSPYGRNLNDWVFRSRLAGHELFMSLPMESENFPVEDAGPLALDTRVQLAENQRRMETVMASAQGYVGLVTMMGSRFMKADGQVRRVLEDIRGRGLMLVVGGNRRRNDVFPLATELNLPRAESEKYIDDVPRIQQIRESLDRLESLAKERGAVLAMARPYPVTIKSVLDWIATLPDKGIVLVPASSVATLSPTQGG